MKKAKLLTLLATMVAAAAMAIPVMADLAPGVTLDFNANDPASGVSSSAWNSVTSDQTSNWSFGADVSLVDASGGTSLSKAYRFTGGNGASTGHWAKYNENADATWELWVKPAGTGADNNQVIFETGGGGDGMAIWYNKGAGTINMMIDDGSVQRTVSGQVVTTEFSHIVFVYNRDLNGNDRMQMWVDGVLADEVHNTNALDDWSGTDAATLGSNGGIANNMAGGKFNGDLAVFRFWENKALTEAEIAGNFDLYLGVSITVIYPENGAVVPSGDVILEWENIDDPCSTDPVYVDVWWGTDPNRFNGGYTQAAAGDDLTTATIAPEGPGVYYWYVDTTIGAGGGDPCTLEGKVYMFTNDGPIASVNAGPDMVTWEGEPVGLIADVNDDGGSALTYLWTADLPSGVTAVFNPSADVADTAVTFARAPYTNANIVNAGFEAEQLDEDGWGSAPGWTAIGRKGSWNPPADSYTDSAVPEGIMCGWAQKDGNGLAQVLAETLAADTQYVLTVEVGNSLRYDWTGYKVQLLAGGTVIAEDNSTLTPAVGTFETSTVTYTYDAVADANKVGLPLEIRMLSGSLVPEGVYAECNFDAVKLTADPAFPATEGVSSVDITLTVKDETNPAVSGTMTIDIYGDACEAARKGFGTVYASDYNVNCQVYPEDLATMAAKWLDDSSAKEPVAADPQPEQADGRLVLFADNFNRPNSTNLNDSTDGKSGRRGILNYVTRSFNSRVEINNNALLIDSNGSDGHHGGLVYIENHNFTDAEIAASGNFSISVDIAQYSTAGSGRYMGVCVGQSLAELEAQNGVAAGDYIADLSVGYRNTTGDLEIYKGSGKTLDPNESVVGGLPGPVTTMRIDFALSDFNAGSTVSYSVYFDDSTEAFTSGTFTWSGTNENYISISSNLTGNSRFDNLEISYVPTGSVQVDAGDGWSTWIGKEVTMSPTVGDSEDPGALFDYNWTAEAMGGLDVAISDPAIEAPAVTITRIIPYWWEIPVQNPSFEDNVLADPDGRYKWFNTGLSKWRFADPDGTAFTTEDNKGYFGQMFLWNPGVVDTGNWNAASFDGEVPDGVNCVIVGSILRSGAAGPIPASEYPGGLAQLLTNSYDPTAAYELSVNIGHSGLAFTMWGGYKVELLAGGSNENSSNQYTHKVVGGTVIGSVETTDPIDPNTWEQVTVSVGPDAANADLAGEPLQIRITSLKIPDDPNTTYVIVDDVKLMTDAPKALEPVTMTLTVNKQGETDTLSDSVTVDVYEDGCELVKAVDPAAIDATDHNIDCVTNLTDFAVLAADWLKDYALTTSKAKQ